MAFRAVEEKAKSQLDENYMSASEIATKARNYAHVLRDDGVGYGDYVEQITFLIFLKMTDERETSGQQVAVPENHC